MVLLRRIWIYFIVVGSLIAFGSRLQAQPGSTLLKWSKDGNSYYEAKGGNIVQVGLPDDRETVVVAQERLKPAGRSQALAIRNFAFSEDGRKVLIYTNAQRVWRYDTRGDYWVLDLMTWRLNAIGEDRPTASLQFAKFSPDGTQV